MSAGRLNELAELHVMTGDVCCDYCGQIYPCDAKQLLGHIAALREDFEDHMQHAITKVREKDAQIAALQTEVKTWVKDRDDWKAHYDAAMTAHEARVDEIREKDAQIVALTAEIAKMHEAIAQLQGMAET
jgi:chromosome segregation ATPase